MNATTSPEVPSVEKLTYNKRELCQALGISDTTVWRWEQRGILKPLSICRHKLYPVDAVRRLVEKGTAGIAGADD